MLEKDFENEVRAKLSEMDEEYKSDEETSDNTEESEFSAESFEDFLSKTESKVSVKKEGCMPSPIFGNRDVNNHNK